MLIDSILFHHSVLFPNICAPISHGKTPYTSSIGQFAVALLDDILQSTKSENNVGSRSTLIDSILFHHSVLFPNIYAPICP
jgi:hypothetical protein